MTGTQHKLKASRQLTEDLHNRGNRGNPQEARGCGNRERALKDDHQRRRGCYRTTRLVECTATHVTAATANDGCSTLRHLDEP